MGDIVKVLTVVNVMQLGADPLTDSGEVVLGVAARHEEEQAAADAAETSTGDTATSGTDAEAGKSGTADDSGTGSRSSVHGSGSGASGRTQGDIAGDSESWLSVLAEKEPDMADSIESITGSLHNLDPAIPEVSSAAAGSGLVAFMTMAAIAKWVMRGLGG